MEHCRVNSYSFFNLAAFYFASLKNIATFAVPKANGTMAEWLGSGLQNRVQQSESAWYLKRTSMLLFVSNIEVFYKFKQFLCLHYLLHHH